jgi:hypothetical protein
MDTLGTGHGSLGIRGHTVASTGVVDASIRAVSAEVCYSVCCTIFVLSFGMWYVPPAGYVDTKYLAVVFRRSCIWLFLVTVNTLNYLLSRNNSTDLYSYQTTGSNIIPLLRFMDSRVCIFIESSLASLSFFSVFRTGLYHLVGIEVACVWFCFCF